MWADIWTWIKTAPLPVVVAINLLLGGWVLTLDTSLGKHLVWAEEQDKNRKEDTQRRDAQLKRIEEKLDRLLTAAIEAKSKAEEAKAKAEDAAKKAEKK